MGGKIVYNKGSSRKGGKIKNQPKGEKMTGTMKNKENKKNLKKRRLGYITATVSALILILLSIIAATAAEKYDFPDGAASVSVSFNGRRVLEDEAAIIDDVTYVPLRSFSELMGAEKIEWNAQSKTATVKKYNMTATISQNVPYIEASGRYFYLSNPLKNINDRIFLPVRIAAKLFCVDVDWNANNRTVVLKSTNRSFVSGSEYYNSDDLYWLSRIINAEASGEVLRGKIAVGNVVLNRRASRSYPNTVYGVVFDRKNGTQFSPVAIGTIYNTPNKESVIAAKICLEGYSLSDSILFFMNPRIATNNWISKNRPFAFKIGNHNFYY
jgi:N-acetylmuramoyl-L-alanine amidase